MKEIIKEAIKKESFWIGVTVFVSVLVVLIVPLAFIVGHCLFDAPHERITQIFYAPRVALVQMDADAFIISLQTSQEQVIENLSEQGFIRSPYGFGIALSRTEKTIEPGAYHIHKNMDAWKLAETLTSPPYMKWVVIPEGLRKEEIANKLAETLDWSEVEKEDWIYKHTAMQYDYLEGVYFPDTYLLPVHEGGRNVAQRMTNLFNEKFAPYSDKFLEQNIQWTTAIRLASIVQREAAGKEDMPLIAGILWNRLLKDMKLEVDATVQYARDERDNLTTGFWKPIKPEDLEIDSKYNTYKYTGLPPFPIANPGLNAIEAVLNPTETDCLYYLHGSDRLIHYAKTYEEHLLNIEEYLK